MKKSLLFASLMLGLMVAVSCKGLKYPNCKTDKDCTEHSEMCFNGQCVECVTNDQCPEGKQCQANRCADKALGKLGDACKTDAQCLDGKCLNGICAASDACVSDPDCPSDQSCISGKCAPRPAECVESSDCPEGKSCAAGRCIALVKDTFNCDTPPRVFFDFNDSTVREDTKATLDKLAQCLRDKPKMKIRIEGHCDERGSTEYNLALGEQRANAVKSYLANSGAEASRLKTISYGEERPLSEGHDEAAWDQNRRGEFVVTDK